MFQNPDFQVDEESVVSKTVVFKTDTYKQYQYIII